MDFGLEKTKIAIKIQKALGVHFSYSQKDRDKENFAPIIKKMKMTLNIWRQRNLTLIGSITLVKTPALSKLTFVSSFEPVPNWAI